MHQLHAKLGLVAATVIFGAFVGLSPAMADDTPTAPDPTSSEQSTDQPTDSILPATTASPTTGSVAQSTDNGISMTTITAATDSATDGIDLAAPGTLVTHIDATSTDTFSMIGLNWTATSGTPITLYAQTHTTAGWSDWNSFDTTGADLLTAFSTEATWVGVSDGLRVQAIGGDDSTITGLQAVLIDTTTGAQTTIRPALFALNMDGFVPQPTIVTRDQWGALPLQTKYCDQQLYDPTDIAITVHHTAGSNDYTAAQSAGIVRGIQVYDYAQQYCDIGYNFLIDKYGTIFEGRGGGANMPVHGAHAGAWNFETVGISFMMNSMTAKPTDAALTSAEQLIAWKLANNYRDPNGTVTINGVKLNTIFMHKDVMNTACPGTYIIAQMGNIRAAVTNIIDSSTPSAIEAEWNDLGGDSSVLGSPFQLEQTIPGGRYTIFDDGSAYWSAATGAHYMSTPVATVYTGANIGGPTGTLGFPTSDPYTDSLGETKQDFQGGWITLSDTAGAVVFYDNGTEGSHCSSTDTQTACMLYFDATGGVVAPASKAVALSQAFGTLPTPARAGYSFTGWFSQPTGGTKYTAASILSSIGDVTAYAQWTANKYKVSFNVNGGTTAKTSGKATPSKTVTMGKTYGTLPTTTRTGYTFAGWFTAKTGGNKIASTSTVATAMAHTLYAQWTAKTYTVKFNPNGGKVSPASQKVTYAKTYLTLPTPTRTGHTFSGWYTRTSGGTKITTASKVTITATQTLYARWALAKYKVTFDSQGGSSASAKTVTYSARYGSLVTPKRTGYTFLGWWTAPTGGTRIYATSTVKITKATTLYARWQGVAIKVTFNANGGKAPTSTSKQVRYGSSYGSLPATSWTSYVFTGWWTSSTGGTQVTSATVVSRTSHQTLYAQWTPLVVQLPDN